MPDEFTVDDRDPLVGGYGGQRGGGVSRSGGGLDVEAERPQLVRER
ncbi:hypothetical protein OHS33_30370 [Streptomyces sp. NBC_00536]|nr:hypothetical protein [Streptomyces sp. NBC_00536]WUC82276.1 hypothetical protein OHS33_30370 [Streptomyces sp. NBC_00536]